MDDRRAIIERFFRACRKPVLCEPGEEPVPLSEANFALEERNGVVILQAWDEARNLVRRVSGVERETRGTLILRTERFGKQAGTLALIDIDRADSQKMLLQGGRQEFRELFRRFLRRNFPAYRIAELTTEADLEHSLSPAYPRALIRQGSSAWAAIGAAPDGISSDGALTFGLIWLDYLRRRETRTALRGLILYLPASREKVTCLRLAFLDPTLAEYAVFVYDQDGSEQAVDLRDSGNLDTRLDPCRRPLISEATLKPFRELADVEIVDRADGEVSLRVKGLEFARTREGELAAREKSLRFARDLIELRSASADDRLHPLYLRNPESWLESEVRNQIEAVDARLLPSPVYGQVPAFAASDRGVLDLLAVDCHGRLTVLELKASEDIHLPLQALDYWMRVKWHADRSEFTSHGYFPGHALTRDPPKLLLVAPALEFHPQNETVLRFFSSNVRVQRIGVGVEWQRSVKVMFCR